MTKRAIDTRLHKWEGRSGCPGPPRRFPFRLGEVRLTKEQSEFIIEQAKASNTSQAEVVRRAIDGLRSRAVDLCDVPTTR